MADENWADEPRLSTAAIAEEAWFVMEFAVLALVLVAALIAAAGWLAYRPVRGGRRAFHLLPPAERELVVKALLFVVHNGAIEKGQAGRGYVRKPARVLADLLALNVHTVDEALRKLVEHGYLGGVTGRSAWSLTTHIETTPKGRSFHLEHFGASGGVFALEPLGLVILSSESPRFPSLPPTPDILVLPRAEDSAQPPTQ
ncbi:hypothetical protein [Kineosporia babensis]|uniref:Uncharacterized protein n=1 Tax=Kineosporia babensis TaxID=499548 RepID=A0A9X1NHM2_9ACTN|nr:hypothetical protein [Kineosporia babensis]MCD5313278.1 hypothetical protein [Kineosporia babensis]